MNPETSSAPNSARRADRRQRTSLPDPLIGRSLGRYHILGALGRGAASVVYLAEPVAPSAERPAPLLAPANPTAATAAAAATPATFSAAAALEPTRRVALKVLTIPD